MDVREVAAGAVITGSIAAVATIVIGGVVKAYADRPLAARVARRNGDYLVAVRGPGEWHDIKEFVQPWNADVQNLYRQIGPDVGECYRWVCENINYRLDADRYPYPEYWLYPPETLRGYGDCEDTSILLCSLLRNFTNAYVVGGEYRGYGHAWVQTDSQILEATLTEPIVVDDPERYKPYFYFNDREAVEIWPGAMDKLMGLKRNARLKLKLIAT